MLKSIIRTVRKPRQGIPAFVMLLLAACSGQGQQGGFQPAPPEVTVGTPPDNQASPDTDF